MVNIKICAHRISPRIASPDKIYIVERRFYRNETDGICLIQQPYFLLAEVSEPHLCAWSICPNNPLMLRLQISLRSSIIHSRRANMASHEIYDESPFATSF